MFDVIKTIINSRNISFVVAADSDTGLADDGQYPLYGHKVTGRIPRSGSQMYDTSR